MEHELALELKYAGFPQPEYTEDTKGDYYSEGDGKIIYAPTLSELIEACPKSNGKRDRFDTEEGFLTIKAFDKGWVAGYDREHDYEGSWFDDEYVGNTPEEAVARLYLALNKK